MSTLVIKSHYRLAKSANKKLIKVIFQSIGSQFRARKYSMKKIDLLDHKRASYKYLEDMEKAYEADVIIGKYI